MPKLELWKSKGRFETLDLKFEAGKSGFEREQTLETNLSNRDFT